jgi:hypothetical protein
MLRLFRNKIKYTWVNVVNPNRGNNLTDKDNMIGL